jgi:RHS repeat-associated protein
VIAERNSADGSLVYLHGDHLGSVALSVNATTGATSSQEFDPWGAVRTGSVPQTSLNYTGQRKDGTGLLYYHARYYDPALARWTSPDSIVPGAAMGAGGALGTLGQDDTAGLRPLTVDFHEPGMAAALGTEDRLTQQQGFWFQLSDHDRQKAPAPWGPGNPQALNRYSYVLENPLRYTDPLGHIMYQEIHTLLGTVYRWAFSAAELRQVSQWIGSAAWPLSAADVVGVGLAVWLARAGITLSNFAIAALAESLVGLGRLALDGIADNNNHLELFLLPFWIAPVLYIAGGANPPSDPQQITPANRAGPIMRAGHGDGSPCGSVAIPCGADQSPGSDTCGSECGGYYGAP